MRSLRAHISAQCVERIWVTSRWEAWLDEDGAAAGKPANEAATLVARSFGAQFSLNGTADSPQPSTAGAASSDVISRR
jgi:hypothetical protein